MTRRLRWWQIVLLALVALLIAAVVGFLLWASQASAPMPEALAALASDDTVTVDTTRWLDFAPTGEQPTSALIFYPGGKVDPRAYAPAAREMAAAGHRVVIVPMPLNFAVFAPNRADAVIAAYPDVDTWLMGGHSLGGAMAAGYARNNPTVIDGLALWASYPAGEEPFPAEGLAVASIYGTNDGVATPEEVLAAQPLLPPSARFVPIEGGNHAQFGWYGEQNGDGVATISRPEQQAQAIAATLQLFPTK